MEQGGREVKQENWKRKVNGGGKRQYPEREVSEKKERKDAVCNSGRSRVNQHIRAAQQKRKTEQKKATGENNKVNTG